MLRELDETIRQILIQAKAFDSADVDIAFDLPNRDWSNGIQKPTLNCYLFDIHERRTMREEGWQLNGRAGERTTRQRTPLFFEIAYLITAWTRAVEDEHEILWRVLHTLARFPVLNDPEVFLDANVHGEIGTQPITACLPNALIGNQWPITTSVAQLEGVLKSPGEFWTALENQLKPSISYVVTLGFDRQKALAGPPVLTREARIQPISPP